MRILLDTHILLWVLFDESHLRKKEQDTLIDSDNDVFVSIISLWEISLKYALGKIEIHQAFLEDFPSLIAQIGFEMIPLNQHEALSFHKLPLLEHKDPFDRMLIWQAIQRNLILMTHDKSYQSYASAGLKLF